MIDGVGPESVRKQDTSGHEFRLPGASEEIQSDSPEIVRERIRGWARGLSNQDLLKEYVILARDARKYEDLHPSFNISNPGAAFISALLLVSTISPEGMPAFIDLVNKADAVQGELSVRLNGIIEELYARDADRFAEAYRTYLGLVAEKQTGFVKGIIAKGHHKLSQFLGPESLKRHLGSLLSSIPDHLRIAVRAETAVHLLGY